MQGITKALEWQSSNNDALDDFTIYKSTACSEAPKHAHKGNSEHDDLSKVLLCSEAPVSRARRSIPRYLVSVVVPFNGTIARFQHVQRPRGAIAEANPKPGAVLVVQSYDVERTKHDVPPPGRGVQVARPFELSAIAVARRVHHQIQGKRSTRVLPGMPTCYVPL